MVPLIGGWLAGEPCLSVEPYASQINICRNGCFATHREIVSTRGEELADNFWQPPALPRMDFRRLICYLPLQSHGWWPGGRYLSP